MQKVTQEEVATIQNDDVATWVGHHPMSRQTSWVHLTNAIGFCHVFFQTVEHMDGMAALKWLHALSRHKPSPFPRHPKLLEHGDPAAAGAFFATQVAQRLLQCLLDDDDDDDEDYSGDVDSEEEESEIDRESPS